MLNPIKAFASAFTSSLGTRAYETPVSSIILSDLIANFGPFLNCIPSKLTDQVISSEGT